MYGRAHRMLIFEIEIRPLKGEGESSNLGEFRRLKGEGESF